MTYHLNLDVFEGPYDLLLYLIKKNEIDIYDIPIAKILEEFLDYVELLKQLDLEVAGDFMLMASTLMHIKSRMLLPQETLPGGESEEEDPRADLVRRLLEYKRYKEVAENLNLHEQHQREIFWRHGVQFPVKESQDLKAESTPPGLQEVNLFDLLTAFKRVITYVGPETWREIRREEIKTSQKINEILDLLEENPDMEFIPWLEKQSSRLAKITAFLALLELARLQAIRLVQERLFGRILIQRVDTFTAAARQAGLRTEE